MKMCWNDTNRKCKRKMCKEIDGGRGYAMKMNRATSGSYYILTVIHTQTNSSGNRKNENVECTNISSLSSASTHTSDLGIRHHQHRNYTHIRVVQHFIAQVDRVVASMFQSVSSAVVPTDMRVQHKNA